MTFSRLAGALLAAGCILILLGLGAGAARGSTGCNGSGGFYLELGLINNCNVSTDLAGTAHTGISVTTSNINGVALAGVGSSSTGQGWGVSGISDGSGTPAYGVFGLLSNSTPGSASAGVYGTAASTTASGPGVFGRHTSSSGTAPGVYGVTNSTDSGSAGVKGAGGTCGFCLGVYGTVPGNGIGVRGEAASGNGWGVEGIGGSVGGIGVYGHTPAASTVSYGVESVSGSSAANAAGVFGTINSHAANAAGVRGFNSNASCCGMGVAGFHAGQGIGVYGEAPNGFAVSGFSPNNWSGYFQGSVRVVGTLMKSAGAFRIDHPLDPAHSYLQHSFVESPDMKNIYDGVVRTNAKGFAVVRLPAYFQALNTDFRYQLTLLGKDAWGAQAIVWEKIHDNRFVIRSEPRVEVSWQVTGIRHDRYANAHRIQVVVPKEGAAEGRYVHPELYGKPLSKSVVVLPGMKPGTQPRFQAAAAPAQK